MKLAFNSNLASYNDNHKTDVPKLGVESVGQKVKDSWKEHILAIILTKD